VPQVQFPADPGIRRRAHLVGNLSHKKPTEPPPTPGLRREGSRGDEKAISCSKIDPAAATRWIKSSALPQELKTQLLQR